MGNNNEIIIRPPGNAPDMWQDSGSQLAQVLIRVSLAVMERAESTASVAAHTGASQDESYRPPTMGDRLEMKENGAQAISPNGKKEPLA